MKKSLRPSYFLAVIPFLLSACYPGIPLKNGPASNNETFTIHYLFTHDGCKVYRFYDCGQNIYFTNCNGEAIAVGDSTRTINRTQLNTKVPGG